MALFSVNPNLAPDIPKPRQFQSGFGGKLKLAIAGTNSDGSSNLFGDFVSDILPPVLGAISTYYGLGYNTGSSVGNLIAKGQDKAAENMLGGTSGAEVNQQQQAKDDRTRGLISTIGNTAASVYSAAGGSTYKSNSSSVGSAEENRILDDALSGVSTQGLQDYVADNGSLNLSKTLNAVGNLGEIKNNLQSTSSFDPSRVDPNSALNKFFGQGNQDFNLGSGLSNYSQSSGMSGLSAAGQQSSIVGGLQGGIKLLDDKKKKSPLDSFFGYDSLNGFNGYQSNSLGGYSSLNGFAEGGVTTSDDYKIYDKNDTTTEDLFIIDKSVAERHGVSDLLSGIAMGQMRYGETVFDQHSTLIQENIMNSNASEEDKISMLGSHVYQELQDQPNREFAGFALGGPIKPIVVKSKNDPRYIAYQDSLNSYKWSINTLAQTKKSGVSPKGRPIDTQNIQVRTPNQVLNEDLNKFKGLNIDPNILRESFVQTDAINKGTKKRNRAIAYNSFPYTDHKGTNYDLAIYKKPTTPVVVSNPVAVLPRQVEQINDRLSLSGLNMIPTPRISNDVALPNISVPVVQPIPGTNELMDLPSMNPMETMEAYQRRLAGLRNSNPNMYKTNNSQRAMPNFAGFAKGGKTKPKPTTQPVSKYLQPANMSGDFTEAKNLYNSWAQSKGLPTLSSSNFDENAAVAFTNYNADRTNQRKLQVETTPYLDSASNSTRSMVSRISLSQFMPELNVQPLDRIVGYNKGGQAVFSDQVVSTTKLPSSDKLLVANNDYFPVAGDNTTTKIPALSKTTTSGDKELRADAFKKESLINNVSSLAQMGLGGLLATAPQPTYSPPAEYSVIRDEIYNNRNQGLSAAENANISQGLQQSYANGVNTVRNIGGGGATQGSILATLGGLSNSLDQGVLNQDLLNANAQRSNLQAAQQASLTDLNLDRSLFAQQQANALETKNNGLALLAQGSQNLYDQGLFNQSYGPDSLYNQLQESQLAGAQRYNDLANIQSQLALDNLAKQGGLGANALTPNTAPIYQLPNVTTPRF